VNTVGAASGGGVTSGGRREPSRSKFIFTR
jgi:hypothetical protein